MRLIQATCYETAKQFYFDQLELESERYFNTLDTYKFISKVYLLVCVYIATSDRLSFASVEIDKHYSLTLPRWKSLGHRWSRGQPQPGSFYERQREALEREPGNEVGENSGYELNQCITWQRTVMLQ